MRFDELPQIFNILKGDMTLIGTRPERPEFVSMLKKHIPYYSLRHLVKPGVTGCVQINYLYGATIDDAKNNPEYDLYLTWYVDLKFDITIILKTIKTVTFRTGIN